MTINENTEVSIGDSIPSIFDNVVAGNTEAAETAFNLAMSEKLTNALDAMKVDIASSLYNN